MAKLSVTRGSQSKNDWIYVQDSSSPSGAPLKGLNYQSAGLTWYYINDVFSSSTAVPITSGIIGTYLAPGTSGSFCEVNSSTLPGIYQLSLPNNMFASGNKVVSMLYGATNMLANLSEYQIDTFTYQQSGVNLYLDQAIPPIGNTPETLGDCLNAARVQGFGTWNLTQVSTTGLILSMYSNAGLLVKAFEMQSNFTIPINPTVRY